MSNTIELFEKRIAEFYGAKYAIAVDCCTHAIELCLRLLNPTAVTCTSKTYLSIPMTFEKLNLKWAFVDEDWHDYYYIGNTNIIDAAVHWERNGYVPGSLMCLSFQYRKHLNLGRGGMILLDNKEQYDQLSKMRFDGRTDDTPWKMQDITTIGYHYYMTIETAQLGLEKLNQAIERSPVKQGHQNYPHLPSFTVFKNK